MTKTTYQQKLLDPRWQKKRLEIFSRDNWICTICGRADLNLQVHHEAYFGNPWDIDNSKLKTVCYLCHEKKHKKEPEIHYLPKHTTPPRIILPEDVEASIGVVGSNIPHSIKFYYLIINEAGKNPAEWIKRAYQDIRIYIDIKKYELNQSCLRQNIIFKWNGVDYGIGYETKLIVIYE